MYVLNVPDTKFRKLLIFVLYVQSVIDTKKNGKISKFWYQYFLEIMYYEDEELYNEFQKIPKEKRQENLNTYFFKFIEKNK